MKINGLSFGISVQNSGVRTNVVTVEPQLIANSTKGGFVITSAASKVLGLASGDYIMFANDAADVAAAVNAKADAVLQFAAENGFDLDTFEGVQACINAATTWYIAKGVAQFKKNGEPILCSVRLSGAEKQNWYDENIDDAIANNRETLINKFGLDESATDDDIKAVYTVDKFPNPQTQSYTGSKLAASNNQLGVGVKLSFSDTNNWEQLKADLEDKTSVKRIFDIDVNHPIAQAYNDGSKDVEVKFYPIEKNADEKPARVGKKAVDDDAQEAE